ncbi:hypothetical protein [Psychroflexus sp. MBR-150]
MLKNILNLDGVAVLDKKQQEIIEGGLRDLQLFSGSGCVKCTDNSDCGSGGVCAIYEDSTGNCPYTCGCGRYCL